MIFKTLDDVNRVVEAGKPQAVIDSFVDNYLRGLATAPYLDVEEEYAGLLAQEDVDDVPAVTEEREQLVTDAVYEVIPDSGQRVVITPPEWDYSDPENPVETTPAVYGDYIAGTEEYTLVTPAVYETQTFEISPAYSANTLRDERLIELETEYPYLIQPMDEEEPTTVESRRPEITVDVPTFLVDSGIARAKFKADRTAALEAATVTGSQGHVFDADEVAQGRMARAILTANETGMTETVWVLADNTAVTVQKAELVEALALSMLNQANIWVQE